MRYKHTQEITERIEEVLRLIETGKYSTPALAKEVGVSIPTVSRIVAALKARGHDIRAKKQGSTWRYVLVRRMRQSSSPDLWPFANSSAKSGRQYATQEGATNVEVSGDNGAH